MEYFFIGIAILFLSGIISDFFKNKISVLSGLAIISAILTIIPSVNVLLTSESLIYSYNFNQLFGAVNFVIDPLSAFFIVVIAIMSLVSLIYSKGYLKPYIEKGKNIKAHIVFLPILMASMMAVVTCQNALMFLICWEIMSLSSFFLVIFEHEKKEVRRAAIKYLVFMHLSVLFIMVAFALLSLKSGSFDFTSFMSAMHGDKHFTNTIFLLLFVGFGMKAGFVPFHNWLPDAHPAAPSHVSAMMSGIMIKTGIYGILRLLSLVDVPSKSICFAVLIISVVSALYGLLYAITQHDVKRFLAYSSIENIGIIGISISVGMIGLSYGNDIVALLGFVGALLHILNHSIFKQLLFLAAGAVYNKTHTRHVELLGGLIKSMPKTATGFLIGAIAICGLPPFNGFVSEFIIYFGMFKALSIHHFVSVIMILFAISSLALVGTMAVLCFSKAFSIIFLGAPRSEQAKNVNSDVDNSMLIPMGFLAVLALSIGLFPQFMFKFALNPVSVFINVDYSTVVEPLHILQLISLFALGFVVVLSLMILLKMKLTKGRIELHETWGCGYNQPNNHMQYTASSYASPFLSMLKPLFKKVFDIEKPRRLFPRSAHFSLKVEDIEEAYIINPILKYDEMFLSKFESMQSGNIQSYIKYGLIFLVVVVIGSLL
ncbi:MAG: hydrogenase [Cyanobacteria bacterium SIG32]|nr:hydrogenase [Cyanobacteria bacterium SIG32]